VCIHVDDPVTGTLSTERERGATVALDASTGNGEDGA
jgi:hypothetical protein